MRATIFHTRCFWACCLVMALLAFMTACGGHGGAQMQLGPKPDATAADGSMAKVLAELDALSVPRGADPAQFKELKLKLRELLLSKSKSKFVATAPFSSRSKPAYFSMAGSGGTGTMAWGYRNEGDYNLDGIVAVSDLTPLGIHFGKDPSATDWANARVADGNYDGNVAIGDLVSIGANFNYRVDGFHLQYSTTFPGDSWATVTDIPFDASTLATGGGHRDYRIDITSGLTDGFYRVVPYDSGSDGIPSDAVAYPATTYYESEDNDDGPNADALPSFSFPAPIVDGNLGAGNTFGDVDGDDTDIFFCPAPEAGTMDFTLIFDGALGDLDLFLFQEGGADPIASSQGYGDTEHVSAAVSGGINYYIMARLYSGYGEYRITGTFTPQGANLPPSAVLNPQPSSGAAPLTTTLNASGSTDDGTIVKYEFDFGEGGGFQDNGANSSILHTYNTTGTYTAQVRVTDNGGLTDTASAQVIVSNVDQPPSAALNPQPSSGAAPLLTTLDASGSTDDGAIVKYEFDFGEGGGFQDYGGSNSASYTYNTAGTYTAQVRVTDNASQTDIATATINVSGGGPGSISGTIMTDVARPLPGVTVTLSDGTTFTSGSTDTNGYYQFSSLAPGTYSVTPSLQEDTFDPSARTGIVVNGGAVGGQDFIAHFYSTITPYPFKSGTPPNQVVVHPALGTTIDVYVEDGSGVANWSPALADAVNAALPRWNLVGDPWNLFHIQFTSNKSNAEIWIYWVPSLGGNVLGLASWSGSGGQIDLPMEIKLATTVMGNPVDGPTEEMGAIHEVGHSLGLWDHSDATSDIMYPIASQAWPSWRDMWTIYTLYHTTPDYTTGGRHTSGLGKGYMEFWIN